MHRLPRKGVRPVGLVTSARREHEACDEVRCAVDGVVSGVAAREAIVADDRADIIERLRDYASGLNHYSPPSATVVRLMLRDAAGEIEVLRAVVNVLDDMLGPRKSYGWMKGSPADEAFRRAIGESPHNGSTDGAR